MIRNVILSLFLLGYSFGILADEIGSRVHEANNLNKLALEAEVKVTFGVDPNDDTTLIIHRESNMKPGDLCRFTDKLS